MTTATVEKHALHFSFLACKPILKLSTFWEENYDFDKYNLSILQEFERIPT